MTELHTTGTNRSASDSRVLVSLLLGLSVVAVFVIMALPAQTLAWLRREFWMLSRALSWLEHRAGGIDFDHVVMFVALGFFWKLLAPTVRWWWIALLMLALATTTELMQYVVPGREPKLGDIRDDLLGAAMGWCLGWLVLRVARWIGAHRRKRPVAGGPPPVAAGSARDNAP